MIATMSQQAPSMSLSSPHPSASKKPRLSLKIESSAATTLKSGATVKAGIDPTSATAFNTLSSAYAAAIELSSPKVATPSMGFDSKISAGGARKSGLRLITNAGPVKPPIFPSQHTQTPGPFNITYPDTPTAAYSAISPATAFPRANIPSFTFTPPQSAHPSDEPAPKVFSFTARNVDTGTPMSPRAPRRRATTGTQRLAAPYSHPRALHSILRNSPLPPKSALTPMSPTGSSRRLADRAGKKLCFNNPLTQTITTERYIRSHIDLLVEEASPHSATDPEAEGLGTLDLAMAYTGGETRDGGQTPGPFEEMRRRMAGLGSDNDSETPGNKKRKRKEKKRRWVWTIGVNEDEVEDEEDERSPVSSSRSQSPESLNLVQNTVAIPQAEDLERTPAIKTHVPSEDLERSPAIRIQIPSKASDDSLLTAVPLTAIQFPFEAMPKTPMTTIQLRQPKLPKTPMIAIRKWHEVPKYNLVSIKVSEMPEPAPEAPLQSPTIIAIDCSSDGDLEMTDRPPSSHSI